MKKLSILFLFAGTILLVNFSFGQKFPRKPSIEDVRSYNQFNIQKVDIGMKKQEVIEIMGGIKLIQTYTKFGGYQEGTGSFRKKGEVLSNPYSRDLKKDKDGNTIEILWYYTDRKEVDGAINKDELTPIILQNNEVVGLGWGFYQDYAKRKEITIDLK